MVNSAALMRSYMEILNEKIEKADRIRITQLIENYFDIGRWTLTTDGKVNVVGDVVATHGNMETFPFKFGKIGRDFLCNNCSLTSLKGAPEIAKSFLCGNNQLKSLVGGPHTVESYNCASNLLTSLIGAPLIASTYFSCINNPLDSLEGLPEKYLLVYLSYSTDLPLLRLVGRKSRIHNIFDSGLHPINTIFNKYVGSPSRQNIIACQKELIDAGYEGNASW